MADNPDAQVAPTPAELVPGERDRLRRHRLAERLLVDVIGVEWEKVHRAAAGWEDLISVEVEARLVDLLGDPATCPHGNPIPGSLRPSDGPPTIRLDTARLGPITIARIEEELEGDDEALRMLAAARLIPGCVATVLRTGPTGVLLRTPVADQLVPHRVATLTWVALSASGDGRDDAHHHAIARRGG